MQTQASNDDTTVSLTAPAKRFIERMVRMSGLAGTAGFRLSVSPGGCSGLSATFSVEPAATSTDEVLQVGSLTLFIPQSCRRLLDGVTIDFVDSPTKTGFEFLDPKAGACGCASGDTKIQLITLS
jgi:iron-sulfur cluster assembly protein